MLVDIVREGMYYMSEIVDKVKFMFNNEVEIEDEEALEMIKGENTKTILAAMKEIISGVDEVTKNFPIPL